MLKSCKPESESNQNTVQMTTSVTESSDDVALNGVMNNTELKASAETILADLCGVMTNTKKQTTIELELERTVVNAVTEDGAHTRDDVINDQTKTLPDLVLPNNMTLNEANTMEDEDEAAEALLQLSKSDTLPDDDSELPLGVLPVDAAPVPITLGKQDVFNAIENFKQTNHDTETTTNNQQDKTVQDGSKTDHSEKENEDTNKKGNGIMTEHQSAPNHPP